MLRSAWVAEASDVPTAVGNKGNGAVSKRDGSLNLPFNGAMFLGKVVGG
jgi:hypothetical protein